MISRPLRALVALSFLAVCGCAGPPPKMQSSFDQDLHRPFTTPGSGEIKGQAFLRQKGGGTVTCAGTAVYLMPDTPFFREAVEVTRRGGRPELRKELPSEFLSILKETQCDAAGNFAFSGVGPGRWAILTKVVWQVGYVYEGGGLFRAIEVRDGDNPPVYLTGDDLVR